MHNRSYKAEGVVLKRLNFGEKDKLVTVFTKNLGKLVLMAKGIRAINSKKAPHLEVFTHISYYAAIGRNLDIVTEAYTLQVFPSLRKNLEKVAYAYEIAEIIDRICAERQEHRNIFEIVLSTLHKIDANSDGDIKSIIEEFIRDILWDLGYLVKGKILEGIELHRFLEEVMEKSLKSVSLLRKI